MRRFLFVILLGGCASTGHYQSWIGAPTDDLVAAWGVPGEHIDRGNGNEAFSYYPGGPCSVSVAAADGHISSVRITDKFCNVAGIAAKLPAR